ncbi:MAG: hypothetical protein R3190_10645 [Thermoanaerobaculia bacterium]|nr:hypothetical protein [Thermoanaerobaculia bacterium]
MSATRAPQRPGDEPALLVHGAYYSLVSGIALPALSATALFSFLGPDAPSSPLPRLLILASVLASLAGLGLGIAAAVRLPRIRGVGLFGSVLHSLYLALLATFQLGLLWAVR